MGTGNGAVDNLPYKKSQAQSLSAVDNLLSEKGVPKLLKAYLIACKVDGKSAKTLEIYRQFINQYLQFARDNNLSEISTNSIRLFLLYLKRRSLATATINAYYRTLNTFFNWLESEGLIKGTPMLKVKPPKLPKKIIKPFSRADIENLLRLCSGGRFIDLRNRAMVLLLLDTGLRLIELTNIQLKDIDFNGETIRVMGKGAKERMVRVGKLAQKALMKYLLLRSDSSPCLWVTEGRKPITRDGIQIAMVRLCRRAGIVDAKHGPNTFRHTAALNYLRKGGDIFTLQNMLGHSNLKMTRRYISNLGAEDMIRAYRKTGPVGGIGL